MAHSRSVHSEFLRRIRVDKVSIDSPSLLTRLCASGALRHVYPAAHGMAIDAPPTGLSPVSIASLFFVLVSVHALTLFLDCLAKLLCLFICPWLWLALH